MKKYEKYLLVVWYYKTMKIGKNEAEKNLLLVDIKWQNYSTWCSIFTNFKKV